MQPPLPLCLPVASSYFRTICFIQFPWLPGLIHSQVSWQFILPAHHRSNTTIWGSAFSPFRQTTISCLTDQPKISSYRAGRGGGVARDLPYRGGGSGNNLSPIQQDSLTSHLDLSNSSVTVTDELAHRSWRGEGVVIIDSLVMMGCAGHTFCIMYKVFSGRKMAYKSVSES